MKEVPFSGEKAMVPWCARYQWPGKKPFVLGTVQLEHKTMQHIVEAELIKLFDKIWGEILPDKFERPRLLALLPGAIYFVPQEDYK